MSGLHLQYSKEIAKELGKIAVCLPGEHVEVGDIIQFPKAKKPLFGKKLPLGTFHQITSLSKLGIDFEIPKFSGTPNTYRFSSKNQVKINVGTQGDVSLGNDSLAGVENDLHIQFCLEGAIFFLAVDCDKRELDDLLFLEKEINAKGKQLVWDQTYLVTSLTIAKKALIVQSKSKSSGVTIATDVNGIKSSSVDISANSNLKITKSNGDLFIKDWSENVTVFMDLVKFEEKVFKQPSEQTRQGVSKKNQKKLIAKKINIQELLNKK